MTVKRLQDNPHWQSQARSEQRAALSNISSNKLVPLHQWAATSVAETHEEALLAIHQEMVELVQRLVGEQKDDLHHERFFATPVGMLRTGGPLSCCETTSTIQSSNGARIG